VAPHVLGAEIWQTRCQGSLGQCQRVWSHEWYGEQTVGLGGGQSKGKVQKQQGGVKRRGISPVVFHVGSQSHQYTGIRIKEYCLSQLELRRRNRNELSRQPRRCQWNSAPPPGESGEFPPATIRGIPELVARAVRCPPEEVGKGDEQ